MAFGTKISELPAATSLTGLELAVVVQDGETRQATAGALQAAVSQRLDVVSAAVSVHSAAITSVNAAVSLRVYRSGDYLDNVQYLEFDTSTTVSTSVGRLSWNIDDGTLNLGLIGGNVVNQLGQELVQRCYNATASTIPDGSVVKVVGATGQRLTVELAQADSDSNSATIFGVATEALTPNQQGYITTEGLVRNIDTQGFADGDILWLSPTTPGAYTNVKPTAPQHLVQVGYVVKGGSVGAGSIFVKVQNGYELGELHDVKVSAATSLSDNEVLVYNASASVWTNSPILSDMQANVSALATQVVAVSALTSVNAAAVAALELRVSAVSAVASNLATARRPVMMCYDFGASTVPASEYPKYLAAGVAVYVLPSCSGSQVTFRTSAFPATPLSINLMYPTSVTAGALVIGVSGTATWPAIATTSVAPGQTIGFLTPASPDATLTGLVITLAGYYQP